MKTKKIVALMLCIMLSATAFIGCSSDVEGGFDVTVADVKVYDAGYGTAWLDAAKEKFEQLYADKGYKINILEKSSSISQDKILGEIQNAGSNTTDLYIVGEDNFGVYMDYSETALHSKDTILLESLDDVYSSTAVRFDGSSESTKIEDKLNGSLKRLLKYQGTTNSKRGYLNDYKGKYYAFPWASGVCGLTINKSVFDACGLELPRTTKELLACYKVFDKKEGVSAVTYGGKDASGFWLFAYDTFFAQYSGIEAENNFWLCQPASGTTASNGYEVYNDEGILKALEATAEISNIDYCMTGTLGYNEIEAQYHLMKGEVAVMPTGNWIYNEMMTNFSDITATSTMMKMPVISALGEKLGITDEKLSQIVKGVDDGKTNAQIASECGVTEAIAARIREARNVYFDYSVNHVAFIPSYAAGKDVAKLFLRFLASDDNLDLYKTKTHSTLPFKYEGSSKTESNAFVKSVEAITANATNPVIYEDRKTATIRGYIHCFPAFGTYSDVFIGLSTGVYSAQKIYEDDYANIEDDWAALAFQAGLR